MADRYVERIVMFFHRLQNSFEIEKKERSSKMKAIATPTPHSDRRCSHTTAAWVCARRVNYFP